MIVNNLELWELVEKTNPKDTKKVTKNGHTFTAIDAYSQIKKATEVWGNYGSKWGLKNTSLELQTAGEDTIVALYKAVFYYPNGEFEIMNTLKMQYRVAGKNYIKVDDEYAKKIETDTITKALSRLGFNADVFMGMFDDNRYVNEMRKEFEQKTDDKQKPKPTLPAPPNKETPLNKPSPDTPAKNPDDSWIKAYLQNMEDLKKQIGDEHYYRILKTLFKIKHANEVKTRAEASKVYKAMKNEVRILDSKKKDSDNNNDTVEI